MDAMDDYDDDAPIEPHVALIRVTFTEEGSLGLRFTRNRNTGTVDVVQVNANTQAEAHPELRAGLILRAVGEVSVVGKSYDDALALIKSGGRPLLMLFAAPAFPVRTSSVNAEPSLVPADPIKYAVLAHCTVREGPDSSSQKVGQHTKGTIIDVVQETQNSQGLDVVQTITPADGTSRGGWVKLKTSKGKVLLERMPVCLLYTSPSPRDRG